MAIEPHVETLSSHRPWINDLPDEILGSIFWLNTFKETSSDDTPVHDHHQTTLSTSQVCRQWRTVALCHSALWGRVINYEQHPRWWIEELLSRSKESPLDIGQPSLFKPILLRTPRSSWALELIFQNAARIRTFSLNIRLQPWNYLCHAFLRNPAPSIEFLAITTAVPFPDCVLTEPLFANDAPRLRAVHLQRCLITFTSPTLHNLTDLSVYDILRPPSIGPGSGNPYKIGPTPNQWLSILKNIPGLRHLTLAGAISSPTAVSTDPEPVEVSLPHLALLTVSSTFERGMALVGHLQVPSECGLRLRLKDTDPVSPDLGLLWNTLAHQLESWVATPSLGRYFQAKLLSGDRVHIGNSKRIGQIWNMSEEEVLEEHQRNSSDPMLWLIFTFDSSDSAVRFLSKIFGFYDRTYEWTTELDLWADGEFSGMLKDGFYLACVHSFGRFERLRMLNLLEQSPLYLLPLFQSSSSLTLNPSAVASTMFASTSTSTSMGLGVGVASSSTRTHVLFPNLKVLVLTGTQVETEADRSVYFTLIAFLLWRGEIKLPVELVYIAGSAISDKALEALTKIPGGLKVSVGFRDSVPPPSDYMNYSLQM